MPNAKHILFSKPIDPVLSNALMFLQFVVALGISLSPIYWICNWIGITNFPLDNSEPWWVTLTYSIVFFIIQILRSIEFVIEYQYPYLRKGWKVPFASGLVKTKTISSNRKLSIGIEQSEDLFFEIVIRGGEEPFVIQRLPNLNPIEKELHELVLGPLKGIEIRPLQRWAVHH